MPSKIFPVLVHI